MNEYHFICKVSELKDSIGKRLYVNDTDIAVFKVDDEIFVVGNICPHQQAPSIYEGFVEDKSIICPLHGWKFRLRDGKMHNGNKGLESFEIKIENDNIFAKVFPKKLNW